MKKSEMYDLCMKRFIERQTSDTFDTIHASVTQAIHDAARLKTYAAYSDAAIILQGLAVESCIDVFLSVLADINIIENDREITREHRRNTILDICLGEKESAKKYFRVDD